jgi:adenine-specific DNA-methyltransferase
VIKYLGSKRTLLPLITEVISSRNPTATVLDLFSGTSRVGHALKARGHRVIANDHNTYAHTLATCYVQADADDILTDATTLVAEFNGLPGQPGYFTHTFCERSRFFQPHNGERIDAIRDAIAAKSLPPELEAVMLVSLMEAADRVDSTTGLQMAYLKAWAPRANAKLELRVPVVLPRAAAGKGQALCLDALDAAPTPADIAYIDPPYNQHSYLGNYHIWESLVRWDKPPVYGTACKRTDVRDRRSPFNSRTQFLSAFTRLIHAVAAPTLIVSFSNEGYLSREQAEAILSARGHVHTIERDYKRYVGAQIGIHNPAGEKVGAISHLRNTEFLFVVASG